MKPRHLAALGMLGCSIVLFETLLTRLFSTTFWYHFGFLAISLAMLGITASGLQVFLRPNLIADDGLDERLARASAGFAVTSVLAVAFHLGFSFVGIGFGTPVFFLRLFLHVAFLAVPFYFAGLAVSMLFSRFHARISRLYFVDLVGSGIGAALLVFLLQVFSGPALAFLVGSLAALAAACFAGRSRAVPWGVLSAVLAVLFLGNDAWGLLRVRYVKSYRPGHVQEVEAPAPAFERWSPVARTTAFGPNLDTETQLFQSYRVFNDAGAPTTVFGVGGEADERLRRLTLRPSKAYLERVAEGRVLIIGAGGGRDIWAALLKGAQRVDAVELSPGTVGLMRGPLAEFSGRIYLHPRVSAVAGEGRSFVEHATSTYRAIELTMVDSWIGSTAGAFLFNENHLYTEEAFRSYVRRLEPDGVLVVTRYYMFDETLRVVSTMISALSKEGARDPADHIFVVRPKLNPSTGTVIAFRNPPSPDVVRQIEGKVLELGGALIWRPYLDPRQIKTGPEERIIPMILRPESFGLTREDVLSLYPRDVRPTTDDRPFFFFTQRSLFSIDPGMHAARRWALPFVGTVVLILAVLSVATMVFPLVTSTARAGLSLPSAVTGGYFASLGVGFMLVEVPLIQRFVLFLGHPTYAFVVVLASLLVASGVGSALSSRLDPERHLGRVLLAIVVTVLAVAPALDPMLRGLLGLSFRGRLLVAVLIVAPLGLLMGMAFPLGIRQLSRLSSRSIPWAWAINGVFSVLTTGLSLLVAVYFGFRNSLLLGGLAYGLAALAAQRFRVRTP